MWFKDRGLQSVCEGVGCGLKIKVCRVCVRVLGVV